MTPAELKSTCNTCVGGRCNYCDAHRLWTPNELYRYIADLIGKAGQLATDKKELIEKLERLEAQRKKITEIIARNCTAWDTSKDKSQGLLPEVVFSNHWLYEELTGEEYVFHKACKKFHIGEEGWS